MLGIDFLREIYFESANDIFMKQYVYIGIIEGKEFLKNRKQYASIVFIIANDVFVFNFEK